jgi:hypothetical protein
VRSDLQAQLVLEKSLCLSKNLGRPDLFSLSGNTHSCMGICIIQNVRPVAWSFHPGSHDLLCELIDLSRVHPTSTKDILSHDTNKLTVKNGYAVTRRTSLRTYVIEVAAVQHINAVGPGGQTQASIFFQTGLACLAT